MKVNISEEYIWKILKSRTILVVGKVQKPLFTLRSKSIIDEMADPVGVCLGELTFFLDLVLQ